ncbi:MAG TPA: ATP-binding protein [Candidatus Babeliales bacterium]|nr:ATP-binding protein [Candidatus Babeliales bacterium]
MFRRDLEKILSRFAKFPVVAILGPRQSGKTTLARSFFKNHRFLNLESPHIRELAIKDPVLFLRENENEYGIILDEFQYAPEILSYIQVESDEKKRPGYFVLTGSQNFLMNQAVSQSLAGRVGIVTLLPLSIKELKDNNALPDNVNEVIFNGGYPRLYAENFSPLELYPPYIHSYLERDVRQLIKVENLRTYQKFMQLCAGRVGQLLNVADIATNCGIHRKTVESWISILEASYVVFTLKPYWENFKKRATKMPKLYFYDTGLACSLLDISSPAQLGVSPFRGPLFESFIISDLHKQYFNIGRRPPLYFWRDNNGYIEVDCLANIGNTLIPIETKSGHTATNDFFTGLTKWNKLATTDPTAGYIVYGGDYTQSTSMGRLLSWKEASNLIEELEGKNSF